MKFLLHPFFIHGTNAAIDDVASHEDEVGMFGIQHVHPSCQFLAVVVIADVEVADHYHLHLLLQLSLSIEREGFAVLVEVVQIAIYEHARQ